MKKIKTIMFLVLLLIVGCDEVIEKSEPLAEVVLRKDKFEISNEIRKLGLRSVYIVEEGSFNYFIESFGVKAMINGEEMNLFSDKFYLDLNVANNQIKIENNQNTLVAGPNALTYNGKSYDHTDIGELNSDEGFISLFAMLIELTNKDLQRSIIQNSVLPEGVSESCLFNASSIRWSRTNAEFKAREFADTFLKEHPDCKKVSEEDEIDVTCAFGDNLCIAGVAIVCNGATCEN